jgi:hypothetical protein
MIRLLKLLTSTLVALIPAEDIKRNVEQVRDSIDLCQGLRIGIDQENGTYTYILSYGFGCSLSII